MLLGHPLCRTCAGTGRTRGIMQRGVVCSCVARTAYRTCWRLHREVLLAVDHTAVEYRVDFERVVGRRVSEISAGRRLIAYGLYPVYAPPKSHRYAELMA